MSPWRFLLGRLGGAALVLLGASLLTFGLLALAPGDAALAIARARHGAETGLGTAALAEIRREAGLDRPWPQRYLRWLGQVLRLDLGHSLVDGYPVARRLAERFQRTAQLALAALAVALVLAVPLGLLAALHRGGWLDGACVALASLGAALPNFWLGILLIFLFSVQLGWLPSFGRGDWRHLVLPALTLGSGAAVLSARLLRSALLEVLDAYHLAATRARGIAEARVIGHHALRHALLPVVTMLALEVGFLLEGAVAVETVFGWHGLGLLLVEAVDSRDYPVIQALVLFSAVVFVVLNLLVDLLGWWLDPRTRPGLA